MSEGSIGTFFRNYDANQDAPEGKEKFWEIESNEFKKALKNLMYEKFTKFGALRIAFLFREKHTTSKGRIIYGSCEKVSDKNKVLNNKDYIIILSWDVWERLNYKQREALIYHELSHINIDDEDNNLNTVGHDLEFFRKEYKLYGAWNIDLELLEKDLKQLDLFQKINLSDDEVDNDNDDGAIDENLFVTLDEGKFIKLKEDFGDYKRGTIFKITFIDDDKIFIREENNDEEEVLQGDGEAFEASKDMVNEMFDKQAKVEYHS